MSTSAAPYAATIYFMCVDYIREYLLKLSEDKFNDQLAIPDNGLIGPSILPSHTCATASILSSNNTQLNPPFTYLCHC